MVEVRLVIISWTVRVVTLVLLLQKTQGARRERVHREKSVKKTLLCIPRAISLTYARVTQPLLYGGYTGRATPELRSGSPAPRERAIKAIRRGFASVKSDSNGCAGCRRTGELAVPLRDINN